MSKQYDLGMDIIRMFQRGEIIKPRTSRSPEMSVSLGNYEYLSLDEYRHNVESKRLEL